jgi:hypothetical protein
VYEISTVTVLIGLRSVTAAVTANPGATPPVVGVPASSVVQMTRRISQVVIHSGYNAANYVSSTEQFCFAVDAFGLSPKICQNLLILND